MRSVMPYLPQYLLSTWSCYYFLNWAVRYSVLHIYTPSWSGSNWGPQSSYWFLIIRCRTAIRCFGVFQSPSIRWLSYQHTRPFSRPYDLFFGMQFSLCFDLWFDFGPLLCWCWLAIPSIHCRPVPKTIKYRKLQSTNIKAFKADIQNVELIRYPNNNATELTQQYDNGKDSVLHTLINLLAPLLTKIFLLLTAKISFNLPNPWMTPAISASKRHRGYLESFWRRNPTALNKIKTNTPPQ